MARSRTISQSLALLVNSSDIPVTGDIGVSLQTFFSLQSLNWSQTIPRQDVPVYGKFAPIAREIVESPEVTLDFSYNFADFDNEYILGFYVDEASLPSSIPGPALVNLLNRTFDEKNYFIFVAPEGSDAVGLNGSSAGIGAWGIGNGFINSYSIEGAVGGFPTASVQVQGLNLRSYTGGNNQASPAINPTTGLEVEGAYFTFPTIPDQSDPLEVGADKVAVIKPGDITLDLSEAGGVFNDYTNNICVQSFQINFDLSRTPQNCLGSKFAVTRDIQFPVNVNFQVEMLAKDMTTGSLAQYLCSTGTKNASIMMYRAVCGTGTRPIIARFDLKNISLESQAWSTSVGSEPQSITTNWIAQIGGSGDLTNGLFLSGRANTYS